MDRGMRSTALGAVVFVLSLGACSAQERTMYEDFSAENLMKRCSPIVVVATEGVTEEILDKAKAGGYKDLLINVNCYEDGETD